MASGSLRGEHVDDTRRALLASARTSFGRRGYAATSIEDIAADARVTKGALYHHFHTKQDLFRAVYDEVERELTERGVRGATAGTDPVERIRLGFAAFLDAAMAPEVQRIALLDAPSVLGAATVAEINAAYSHGAVRAAVQAGIDAGMIEAADAAVLAELLLGACTHAALLIATATDARSARREVGAALDRLITGLAPSSPGHASDER